MRCKTSYIFAQIHFTETWTWLWFCFLFPQLLPSDIRMDYLPMLTDFLTTDNNRNWRFRFELAEWVSNNNNWQVKCLNKLWCCVGWEAKHKNWYQASLIRTAISNVVGFLYITENHKNHEKKFIFLPCTLNPYGINKQFIHIFTLPYLQQWHGFSLPYTDIT